MKPERCLRKILFLKMLIMMLLSALQILEISYEKSNHKSIHMVNEPLKD